MEKKIKRMNKLLGVFLAFGIFVVLLSVFAAAFAIGSPSAFNLEPGESLDTSFSIMNRGEGAEDIVVEVVVEEGSEYVVLTEGNRFEVPAGEVGAVSARVSVPEGARVGDTYSITLLFAPVEGGVGTEGGTVDIAFGYRKTLDINVVSAEGVIEEPATTGGNVVWWVVGIVIVLLIIWYVMKGSGNRGKGKKK